MDPKISKYKTLYLVFTIGAVLAGIYGLYFLVVRLRRALKSRSGGTVVNERRGSVAQRDAFFLSLQKLIENMERTKLAKKAMLVVLAFEDVPMLCFNSWLIFREGLHASPVLIGSYGLNFCLMGFKLSEAKYIFEISKMKNKFSECADYIRNLVKEVEELKEENGGLKEVNAELLKRIADLEEKCVPKNI